MTAPAAAAVAVPRQTCYSTPVMLGNTEPRILNALVTRLGELGGCVGFVRDVVEDFSPPEAIHPDDHASYLAVVGSGGTYRVTYRTADGLGGWRHVVEQGGPVALEGRTFLVGAVTDITQRLEAERARQRYEAIVESQAEWIVRQTPDGHNTFVNEAYCRFRGMTREELTDPHHVHLEGVMPESLELFRANRASLGPERLQVTTEIEVFYDDGSTAWQVWTDMAILDEAGRIVEYQCIGRDSTAERKAQAALKASEARYRDVVEAQTDLITRVRPNGRATFVNDAYCRYMGMTREQLLDPAWDDLSMLSSEGRTAIEADWAALTPEAPTSTHECEAILPDGRRTVELWDQRGIFDAEGHLLEVQGVGRDITGQRETERALRESEARLRAILETQTEWVTRRNAGEKAYTFVNEAYCRYMGLTREQMTSPDYYDGQWVLPEDLERYLAARARLTPENSSFTIEIACRHPIDGSVRFEEWTEVALFDETKRVRAYQMSGREMTGQRRAEAALRESEQRFRRFAEAHPVPLCALRTDNWRVLFANPAYLDLFELTLEELDAADKRSQWADPERRAPYYERVRREGRTDDAEVILRRKDGTTFPALLSSRLMEFEGVDTVVNSVVDLSRQRAAEAEIQRQRDALHQSEKMAALGSLLAGVAHELNNPLSVVVGYAALLREDARSRKAREQAERIHSAAQRCARIVKTFLAMARQKPPSFGPVDLAWTVDAALELAAYGLRTSGVQVTTALPPDLPAVYGDADQLHQVVANLIINAKQAMQDVPGPRRLEIAVEAQASEVRLTVTDNGPGIAVDALRRVFEPFFTTKTPGVGTGLGLSVCHGIITAHGGRIEMASPASGGTRVEVRLPATLELAAGDIPETERMADEAGLGARILVVEDEAEIAGLISQTLARDGHRVDRAIDGAAALARIARGGIDLVISDLRMPGMDGAALLRSLRVTYPTLARSALLLTGDLLSAAALPELSGEEGTAAAAMLLEKPIDPEELRRAVRTRLAWAVTS